MSYYRDNIQEQSEKSKEVEGLGIMNIEVPTQTKKPASMAKLCTCHYLCQHKKFARDKIDQGRKQERPDVYDVLRRAEARKGKR